MKPEAFVADWKRKEVSAIHDFVQSAPVVGLVDVSGIGAKQMLTMRSSQAMAGSRWDILSSADYGKRLRR